MSPMFTLLLGIVAWIGLNIAGMVLSWPFAAGVLTTLGFFLFLVLWAFDGAGRAAEQFFGNPP